MTNHSKTIYHKVAGYTFQIQIDYTFTGVQWWAAYEVDIISLHVIGLTKPDGMRLCGWLEDKGLCEFFDAVVDHIVNGDTGVDRLLIAHALLGE